MSEYSEYGFGTPDASHMHRHFMPCVLEFAQPLRPGLRVLDVGCGNGYLCGKFLELGASVVGVDLSVEGIQLARGKYPGARFELIGADEDILGKLNEDPFDLVVSTEVVEHLYRPRLWANACFAALKPGGRFICTTPYHGYWKNLVISLLGRWDAHANPLWDGGHIKLWSKRTLSELLVETGFRDLKIKGVGRMPGLRMTMVASGEKPA
ncbi:MAG: SAM-dependent methyltransferase [Verrucomicrobia bacterium]|nr:MAG: SAM-dependent methyltransferase [Verrucomicrobiota bacterium]